MPRKTDTFCTVKTIKPLGKGTWNKILQGKRIHQICFKQVIELLKSNARDLEVRVRGHLWHFLLAKEANPSIICYFLFESHIQLKWKKKYENILVVDTLCVNPLLTIVKCCLGYIRISSNVPVDIYITYIFYHFLIETWFWSHPNSRGRCNFIIWLNSMRRPKMIFFSKTFTLLVASVWFGIKVMVNLNTSQIKRTLLFWELHFRCIIF